MNALFRDFRYGLRVLWKDRRFSITAILTLAICFAMNIAVFTVVNSVILRPLSLPDGDRLVLMANQYPGQNTVDRPNLSVGNIFSYAPDYFDRLGLTTVFESQAMFTMATLIVDIENSPQRLQAMVATPSLFRLAAVPPVLGRAFDESEGQIGNERKVMLSYGSWQRLFNRDPAAVGRDLRINGRPYQIVGVMPQDFVFINARSGDRIEAWVPLAFTDAQRTSRHESVAPGRWMHVGRLRPGATIEQARGQLRALDAANFASQPEWQSFLTSSGFYSSIEPVQEFMIREVRPTLYFLWAGASLLLVIGGVNIANLVLARSTMRMKEVATRLALGAGPVRIARQLVIENVVLAVVSGTGGLLVGAWLLGALTTFGLSQVPRAAEIRLDEVVVVWTLIACVIGGVLIGLVPVAFSSMPTLADVLRFEGRSITTGRGGRVVRHGLIVVQVALAFALTLGSGLLIASFRQLLNVDPGFSAEGVVTAAVTLPASSYPDDRAVTRMLGRSVDALRSIPGVTAAGVTDSLPFDGVSRFAIVFPDGVPQTQESLVPRLIVTTPGYFETMRIRLVRGRYLDERDHEGTPRVAVIEERLARRFWPDRDPIGQTLYVPFEPSEMDKPTNPDHRVTVVGVVRTVRQWDVAGQLDAESLGIMYTPYAQPFGFSFSHRRTAKLVVKSQTDGPELIRRIRAEMASIDAALPLWDVRTMQEQTDRSLTTRRSITVLTVTFGTLALLLAALGIYGVLSYLVAQRKREVGIRIALGGTASHIIGLILREGVLLIAAGLVTGFVAATVARRLIEGELYGVKSFDPTVIASTIVMLVLVSLFACLVPARRATRVDPVVVLNEP